ncbi:hypothetical protein MCOR27_008559 [Pyricularia oryzae]|uniref:Cutinase n=3 Tax=Pyricularia TaxID=48558 RepID=A0ABQ8NAH6_PYRGI|nr:hypothetical protein MCOR01_004862 [Pyricularia oryzae]KAI6293976.1 hypothetical protein MCOR33_008778 [Pyricularia grisea]KAH9431605.1 hypothetical protein MCOR02_008895 [Pyricularia oryzae]KAI6255288.1 hypothetical protein MCOR19_008206 [Pyricularia oryzae]KAI6269574.1 hypothetical protein MCOR26_008650 [Pyricularia oryzae]
MRSTWASLQATAAVCCMLLGQVMAAERGDCATSLHMIAARGSLEAPGAGFIGKVATDVVAALPGSDFEPLVYPATLNNYTTSEQNGTEAMLNAIIDYATRCPQSKIAIMGYSQGAQVSADAICGTSESTPFTETQALVPEFASKIVAVVLMGDPSRVKGAAFNQGNSTKNGVFPRKNIAGCGNMISRMVSYCDEDDLFCDSGKSLDIHVTYVQRYGAAAAKFILDQAAAPAQPAAPAPAPPAPAAPAPAPPAPAAPAPGPNAPAPAPPAPAAPAPAPAAPAPAPAAPAPSAPVPAPPAPAAPAKGPALHVGYVSFGETKKRALSFVS